MFRNRLWQLMMLALVLTTGFYAHAQDDDEAEEEFTGGGGGWGYDSDWGREFIIPGDRTADWWSDDYPAIFCEQCRDPNEFPNDFGNMAWNMVFGPDGSLALYLEEDLAALLKIINPEGQWVMVTFDDWLDHMVVLPTTMMTIEIRLPNGEVISVQVLQQGPNLPIGDQNGGTATGDGSSGGGGGSDSSYDYDVGDFWDGWENGYGGQIGPDCWPTATGVACRR